MKIFAIGMNYAEHNKELGETLYKSEEPVIFTKADSALLTGGKPFFIPDFTERCEYETEIVVRISRLGRSIAPRWAHRYYDAVTVGIDFTARDLQQRLRTQGLPWELCKGFDGSAVLGRFIPLTDLERGIQDLHFHLDINGQTVQTGHTADMLHPVDELVSYISRFFTLKTGDLIYTGTPVGVGPVHIDDHLEGWLEGEKVLAFNVK
ncbi:MAG: fumarylacetoacetate hydrolase family protein [Prevotella sp.]|nr:fumarylacetoacetate hydrolase family protein [Prevotella sp.]